MTKCAMPSHDYLKKLADIERKKHKKKIEELKEFAKNCCMILPRPGGFFGNKCPFCKHKVRLTKHSINEVPHIMSQLQYWEYICPDADYRYVEERCFS